jgi:hypothetical protein
MLPQELVPGRVVTHFRAGGIYDVIGIGYNSEDRTRLEVMYYSRIFHCIWIRPCRRQDCRRPEESAFCDTVEHEGKTVDRFRFIAEAPLPLDQIMKLARHALKPYLESDNAL